MSLFEPVPEDEDVSVPVPPVPATPEAARRLTRTELQLAAPSAVRTLKDALTGSADGDQVKAAIALLDRAGFGPHSTIAVDEMPDLTRLTPEQISARIKQLEFVLAQIIGKYEGVTVN